MRGRIIVLDLVARREEEGGNAKYREDGNSHLNCMVFGQHGFARFSGGIEPLPMVGWSISRYKAILGGWRKTRSHPLYGGSKSCGRLMASRRKRSRSEPDLCTSITKRSRVVESASCGCQRWNGWPGRMVLKYGNCSHHQCRRFDR